MTIATGSKSITVRVALYARFSSDQQRDASIEDQLRVCRVRVEREGWQVQETFTDSATSGATMLRVGYQGLLKALRSGAIDIVVAESLDRFSRDLEHIASFHKQCVFHQVRIYTIAEGDVSELHIGVKGMLGALYLKDLAEKTKRGLEGRIHAGRCTSGPAYGYSMVRNLNDDGEIDRGLRTIDPERAAVVRRIFVAYSNGSSPRKIARTLNADGVPGPGGGCWYDASIRGRKRRGDGILRNELYIGRIVWRRRVTAKDPTSGKSLRREAPPDTYVTKSVPNLRIIDEELWHKVQQRLVAEAAPVNAAPEGAVTAFWDRRRARHLLSGTLICGVCGRAFTPTGKDYLGCRVAVHGACRNRRTVRRRTVEALVLDLLGRQLMQPELVAEFIAAYNEELKRAASEHKSQAAYRQRERAALDRKVANLVDAISEGRTSAAILARLAELEAQRDHLGSNAEDDAPALSTPTLHRSVAQTYADNVSRLNAALAAGDDPEALERARALLDKVVVHPPQTDDDPPGIELIGNLMGLLQAAGAILDQPPEKPGGATSVLALFISSVKEGRGAEPPPASKSQTQSRSA